MHQNKTTSKNYEQTEQLLESSIKQGKLDTKLAFDSKQQGYNENYQDLQEQDSSKELTLKNANQPKQTQDLNQENSNQIKQDSLDFEARVEKVKLIIEKLNNSELSLKDGIELYQEAKEHLIIANEILEQAEFELKDILQ